jgi:hypothetical protein
VSLISAQVGDFYGEILPSDSVYQTVKKSSSWPPPISIVALANADEYIVMVNTEECLEQLRANRYYNFEPSGRAD